MCDLSVGERVDGGGRKDGPSFSETAAGLPYRAKAGVLPDCPRAGGVHGRVRAPRVRIDARVLLGQLRDIRLAIHGLQLDTLQPARGWMQ
jgi:hypothetical protein